MPGVTLLISLHCIWPAKYKRLLIWKLSFKTKYSTPLRAALTRASVRRLSTLSLSTQLNTGALLSCSIALVVSSWSNSQVKTEEFPLLDPLQAVLGAVNQEHSPFLQVTAKFTGGWARVDGWIYKEWNVSQTPVKGQWGLSRGVGVQGKGVFDQAWQGCKISEKLTQCCLA